MKTVAADVVLRILHVEDDPRDRELVLATLRHDGLACSIRAVATREEFEAALASESFDVILADDRLPAFDGLAAQQIAAARAPHVPLIFVSGTLGEEVAVERLKSGAVDYVLKQRLARLSGSIRRAIAEVRTRLEHARAEIEVRRLNAELEQRVLERTEQLKAARREAERANRAKSEFLSRMSHDLRTPLNSVLGFAQLLAAEELSDDQGECVRQILRGGGYLLDLINEVLDIARIEAGHLSLSQEPVEVRETVTHAATLVGPLARRRQIVVAVEESPLASRSVIADRQRLSQILLNLLSNAVKYNRATGTVTVGFELVGDRALRINVTDTGPGIPSGKLRLLFRPFERLGAESTAIEGTGLGLTLSRGLAEAMGGSVGVVSRVGVGSTFWVELQLAEQGAVGRMPIAAEEAIEYREGRAANVLYIEDNLSNVRLMERILGRRPSLTLTTAASGQDGLARARAQCPDLVLLDLHLPDVPGEEVLGQLKGDAALSDVPVIVLSADATPGQVKRLLASGATAYLTKPLAIPEVLAAIDRVVQARTRADDTVQDCDRHV